jgi:hypothetical protein
LSGKNNETLNLKRAANQIRRDERDALIKAESDARLAVDKAVKTRDLEFTLARENEINTLRDMERQFDNAVKSIREANRNRLDEIKRTRANTVTEARNKENATVKSIYNEESTAISGADRKTIQRIKYDTLKKVRQARYDTERAINEALFEEKHATRKALDIAYRDIEKEEESQKRTRIRTIVDARNTRVKAVSDADLQYRRTIDDIAKSYRQSTADIRKQAQEDILNLKNNLRLIKRGEIPSTATLEEKQQIITKTAVEDESFPESEEQPLPETPVSNTETIAPNHFEEETVPAAEALYAIPPENIESAANIPAAEILEAEAQGMPKESIQQEAEEPVQQKTEVPVLREPEKSSEIIDLKEVAAVEEMAAISLPDEENATASVVTPVTSTTETKESVSLYSGIVKIAIKSPAETHKIKSLGNELNKIDKVRILFISGEVNKDTIMNVKLDEELPLVDILKTLPDIADISVKNKNIQVTLKSSN